MTSSAASETDSASQRTSGSSRAQRLQHGQPAAAGQVHVEQDDVRTGGPDALDRGRDVGGLADHVDVGAQLGPHTGADHRVVVDDEHPRLAARHAALRLGSDSSTSVPSPGAERTSAVPPSRVSRPVTESRSPRRSGGTAAGSNPAPRSRTKTETRSARHLRVEVGGRRPRVLGGVDQRLAGGRAERRERVVHRGVARRPPGRRRARGRTPPRRPCRRPAPPTCRPRGRPRGRRARRAARVPGCAPAGRPPAARRRAAG